MGLFSYISRCPSCGKDTVYPSRARSHEEGFLWSLGLLTYFRCHECGWREPRIALSERRLRQALSRIALVALGILLIVLLGLLIVHFGTTGPTPSKKGKSHSGISVPASTPRASSSGAGNRLIACLGEHGVP